MSEATIRIYVACLASYNSGILYGKWIDANQDAWDIQEDVNAMLDGSSIAGAEEWAIHDYEGFQGYQVSEWECFSSVSKLAAFIDQHGKLAAEMVSYFGDVESAKTAFEDHYIGQYESVEDYARELTEETTQIPDNIAAYIDYERMARDLQINDLITFEVGFQIIHIFWSH